MEQLDILTRLGIALAIGLLVGLERGWRLRGEADGQRIAGLRTFALTGLLGGVSGALAGVGGAWVLGFAFLGYAGAFTAFHLVGATAGRSMSATATVAGLLTFLLGAYAMLGEPRVAVAGAVATTLLLALREPLHQWLTALRWEEIRAVLVLLVMTFLLLPVLPNRTLDPWQSVNPYEVWLLAILIAAISFGGYLAVRLLGDRLGILVAAAAGGLASSTATTLTLAKLGRARGDGAALLSAGILVAGAVMVLRVLLVVFVLNRALAAELAAPLGALLATMAVGIGLLLLRRQQGGCAALEISNPLELGTALKLAALIAVVLLAAGAAKELLGEGAILAVAAVSGIGDVDAVTISMARLGGASVGADTAVRAVAIAVATNTVSKAVMAASLGGPKVGAYVGGTSTAALLAALAAVIWG